MIHLIFILIILSVISNSIYSAMNRINNKNYHYFEIVMFISTFLLGYSIGIYGDNYITFIIIYLTIRFGVYNIIFNAIIKQPLNYLGTWGEDKFIKWLFYDKLNQPTDLIIYCYFMAVFTGVGLYLGLLFN